MALSKSFIIYHLLTSSVRPLQGNLRPRLTERTRLISYLLYGLFSAVHFQYPLARARGHSRSCSLNRNEPGHAIETRRNGFFDNEAIFVFITPRSRANLTTLIFTASQRKRAVEPRKIFIMPGHYKKIMPAQQPIRARVLL